MTRARWPVWGGAIALAAAGVSAVAGLVELGSGQIRSTLTGKYVTADHHWAHYYLADGRLTRVDKGRVKPGRWAVQRDRLCLTMPGFGTEPACYSVQRVGSELQYVDHRGYVAWQGFVRDKAHTPLFDTVKDPGPLPAGKEH